MRTAALSSGLRMVAVVTVLLGMLITTAPPAAAHTNLAASAPRPGAVVTQLDTIRLEFYGPLLRDGQHAIRLLDPEGERWDNTPTQMVFDRALLVGVAPDLARQGEYTVRWCTLTPDGHSQSGAYVFNYAGLTRPSTRPPTTADAPAACQVAATRTAANFFGWPIVGLAATFVLFLIMAALLNRRPHQRPR